MSTSNDIKKELDDNAFDLLGVTIMSTSYEIKKNFS